MVVVGAVVGSKEQVLYSHECHQDRDVPTTVPIYTIKCISRTYSLPSLVGRESFESGTGSKIKFVA